ncbi:MAG: carbohydrate kinase family protein [Flavobacteriaceae bacterium]|nr:carbohydrate kinase family protein [Flavobacteriaceae bacterium]
MKKYDVIIAGYICVDLTPGFKKGEKTYNISQLFKPGSLTEIEGLNFTLGGAVANTGMALKRFNKKVFLNGLVGDDFIGNIALESLEKYNLSEGIKITKQAGTAFGIVIAPPGVDRIFLESPGCSTIFSTDHLDFEAISQSRLFHFGYPPLLKQFYSNNGDQLLYMFSEIQKMGVVTSLDFSLPDTESESGQINWIEILERILPFTDIFVPSLEEALQIMMPEEHTKVLLASGNTDILDQIPLSTIKELGRKLIACGAKIILIKAGHRGIYLLTSNVSDLNSKRGLRLNEKEWNHREFWIPAFPPEPEKFINATGAGDTAAAAFISAILDGNSPNKSIAFAALAGRNNLYCNDIYKDLAGWSEMEKEIKPGSNEIIKLN